MRYRVTPADVIGLVRPALDAHTLGIDSMARLLTECGLRALIAGPQVCAALDDPGRPERLAPVERWLRSAGVTVIGLSYRLGPEEGERVCTLFVRWLRDRRLCSGDGSGRVRAVYFAGLPETCARVLSRCPEVAGVFTGGESAAESIAVLGVSAAVLPRAVVDSSAYDEERLAFGRSLVAGRSADAVAPPDRSRAPFYGRRGDHIEHRIADARARSLPPVIRAHVGPFLPDRRAAVSLFLEWVRRLAAAGYLDVLSIGTSQLSQEAFGDDRDDRPDGGGVPLNTVDELRAVREAAGPMLVRTYAGTRDVRRMAELFEEHLDTAWHALSFWWFCRTDGRGPNRVEENLRQHLEVLRYAAATGKPFEPNIPHHFAFRGADDATCIVSALLAALVARELGVRHCILQAMLSTPRSTWGTNDLAKVRVLLRLAREMETPSFTCYLQPRAGLDSFSSDPERAKVDLAASTALMDDIEADNPASPDIIHVVGYTEASRLADPAVVDESIRITLAALAARRADRRRGQAPGAPDLPPTHERESELEAECRALLAAARERHPDLTRPGALAELFASGFLPVPWLAHCREEYPAAVAWNTAVIAGSVRLVDESGAPLSLEARLERLRGTPPA